MFRVERDVEDRFHLQTPRIIGTRALCGIHHLRNEHNVQYTEQVAMGRRTTSMILSRASGSAEKLTI